MRNQEGSTAVIPVALSAGAAGVAAAVLIAAAAITVSPRPAQATPTFAKDTHLPCGRCHAKPTGGAELTDFGKAFHANGDKVPPKK